MARAKVTLRNCLTFEGPGGVTWKKGQTRTLSDGSQISYYRSNAEFVVTDLPDAAPAKKPAPAPAPAPADDGGGDDSFTEAELKRLNKGELVDLGAEAFGLTLDSESTKKELVSAILEAQG